jgi:hypothetical protein
MKINLSLDQWSISGGDQNGIRMYRKEGGLKSKIPPRKRAIGDEEYRGKVQ